MAHPENEVPEGLRRVDPSGPGITRTRRGRGFRYRWPHGPAIEDRGELARIRALAVPPAWTQTWICPDPDGHIQAVGTDAAGRRQYLYHPRWRQARDRDKHDRVLRLARRLPRVRDQVAARLADRGLGRERVLAGTLRMLELGAFRVGGDEYTPENTEEYDGSFGLATLRREHVRRVRGQVKVAYRAKGGAWREIALRDPEVHRLVGDLLRRGSRLSRQTPDLLVYHNGRRWHDVRAEDINTYLKELAGDEFTAKDLRTWNATVLAASILAGTDPTRTKTATGRRAAIKAACQQVADHLGNTATIALGSYIDPRVTAAFERGHTIRPRLVATELTGEHLQKRIEPAVVRLLAGS